MTDVLTDVLQTVRVSSARCGRLECAAPWKLGVEASGDAVFHVVLSGSCELQVEGAPRTQLRCWDAVTLPHGQAHVLLEGEASRLERLEPFEDGKMEFQRVGAQEVTTRVLSGRFCFEERQHNPLLAALPQLLHLRSEEERAVRWLEATLQFMACEADSGRPGSGTVVSRLADVLFIQMVRGHLHHLGDAASWAGECSGWLAALGEPHIGAALGLIHEQPAEPWTVALLASRVGMSRSAFAARFTQLVGEPPLHYVTRWRMQKAAELLRASTATLSEVATRVGYESEAAFSKAFKRWSGVAPGGYRRSVRRQGLRSAA